MFALPLAADDPYFGIAMVVMLLVLVGILLALGKWYPGSGAEQLDWKPTRSYEDEIRLELEDVDQMLEAQNERRRASGRPEISEDSIRAEVDAEERAQAERAEEFRKSQGEA
ncbi:MAG: hypothetical protein M3340_06580 [Actinomycetota bacterium]|nr:hypothetical protein [Actinomycetota bacterium]